MIPVRAHRLSHWRDQQARYAMQDMQVLDALSQGGNAVLSKELEHLIAKGELRWDLPSGEGTSEEHLATSENMSAVWTLEPSGFQRMYMSHAWTAPDGTPRSATLIRRFPDEEIRNALGDGSVTALISAIAAGLVAGGWLFYRYRFQRDMRWLRAIEQRLQVRELKKLTFPSLPVSSELESSVQAISDFMNIRIDAITASYENSSHAMSNVPIGILSFDKQLCLAFINPAGRSLLSLEKAREGKKLFDVVRAPLILDCIQETHRTGKPTEVEYERSTEKRWLRVRTHPLAKEEQVDAVPEKLTGEPNRNTNYSVLLTVIDETRLKQLENLRRDFTANVSHELKTPLAAIKAYAETLLMGAREDPEACKKFVERISEQANRLDALIRDLLQLTRLQSQPQRPKLYPINVVDLLSATIEDHRAVAENRNISIELDSDDGISIRSDLESLQIVLNNLLSNAIRYNKPDGSVCVSASVVGNQCSVVVSDTGIGIPAGDKERIFERFYRVEKARSQDLGGTGLGLSIVKHVCQSIGAEIHVKSELGVGSTFTLKLPLSSNG